MKTIKFDLNKALVIMACVSVVLFAIVASWYTAQIYKGAVSNECTIGQPTLKRPGCFDSLGK